MLYRETRFLMFCSVMYTDVCKGVLNVRSVTITLHLHWWHSSSKSSRVISSWYQVTATCYGLDGPGIESLCGRARFCTPVQSDVYNGLPGLFTIWKSPGAWPWLPTTIWRRGYRESRTTPLIGVWSFVACSRATFTF
jgi:hypothetical protein